MTKIDIIHRKPETPNLPLLTWRNHALRSSLLSLKITVTDTTSTSNALGSEEFVSAILIGGSRGDHGSIGAATVVVRVCTMRFDRQHSNFPAKGTAQEGNQNVCLVEADKHLRVSVSRSSTQLCYQRLMLTLWNRFFLGKLLCCYGIRHAKVVLNIKACLALL